MVATRCSTIVWLLLLAGLAGCGRSGPELAPVSGRITLDGKPLATADVVFQPDNSKSPSYGRTNDDGRYELGYKRGVQGALVGPHRVNISVSRELVRNPPQIEPSERRVEVKSENNEFNFDLTSDK